MRGEGGLPTSARPAFFGGRALDSTGKISIMMAIKEISVVWLESSR